MILLLACVVATVQGAAIPPQPVVPTTQECLRQCFEQGSAVNAANDLTNFKALAVDIEDFCKANFDLAMCGLDCPEEERPELVARMDASNFVCENKVEEFRLSSECLAATDDILGECATSCATSTGYLSFDSSPESLVNPTVMLDGIADVCEKQTCVAKCAIAAFNKACAGSGELFKDMARHQVEVGSERIMAESQNATSEVVQQMAQAYLDKLPAECALYKDVLAFDKAVKIEDENEGSEMPTQEDNVPREEVEQTTEAIIEPDIPTGPPDEESAAATVEPNVEVKGQEETDAVIIDQDKMSEKPTIDRTAMINTSMPTEAPAVEASTVMTGDTEEEPPAAELPADEGTDVAAEIVTSEAPVDEKQPETTSTMAVEESTEPVIVIDNTNEVGHSSVTDTTGTNVNSAMTSVLTSSFAVVLAFILTA